MSFKAEGKVSVVCPSCAMRVWFTPRVEWLTVVNGQLSMRFADMQEPHLCPPPSLEKAP